MSSKIGENPPNGKISSHPTVFHRLKPYSDIVSLLFTMSLRVYVKNVPTRATSKELEDIFEKYGPITSLKFSQLDDFAVIMSEYIGRSSDSAMAFICYLEQNELSVNDWEDKIKTVCIEYEDGLDANDAKKALKDGKIMLHGQVLTC